MRLYIKKEKEIFLCNKFLVKNIMILKMIEIIDNDGIKIFEIDFIDKNNEIENLKHLCCNVVNIIGNLYLLIFNNQDNLLKFKMMVN